MVPPETPQSVELGLFLPAGWLRVWSHPWGPASGHTSSALDLTVWVNEHQLGEISLSSNWEKHHQVDLLWEGKGLTLWVRWRLTPCQPGTRGLWTAAFSSFYSQGNTIFMSQVKATVASLNRMFGLPIWDVRPLWHSGVPSGMGTSFPSLPGAHCPAHRPAEIALIFCFQCGHRRAVINGNF